MMDNAIYFLKRQIGKYPFLKKIRGLITGDWKNICAKPTKKSNYECEVDFWDSWLSKQWKKLSSKGAWEKIFPRELLSLLENHKGKVRLLEVGSGPVSMLAWAADQNLCEIVAIDPLAAAYDKIMGKQRYVFPIKPIVGFGEKISKLFPDNSFDMVYSSNALDHVKYPEKCFKNIYNVVKKNGFIILEGYINEGTLEQWEGLHRHDLLPVKGVLLSIDKKGKSTELTKNLNLECVCQKVIKARDRAFDTPFVRNNNDNWYTVVYKKL
ncbi:MAG: class I SAM-dependent methyltransferase [Candidatus Omnitrophica bacterium]|nr:class I SAM-dependent methyltransferase [Candidatus Omnitrophota bacterium]